MKQIKTKVLPLHIRAHLKPCWNKYLFVFHLKKNLGEECEFSSVSGTLRMLYHDQVYQYVINEHEYFSHVFQGK